MGRKKSEARVAVEAMVVEGKTNTEIVAMVNEKYPETKNLNVMICQVKKTMVVDKVIEPESVEQEEDELEMPPEVEESLLDEEVVETVDETEFATADEDVVDEGWDE